MGTLRIYPAHQPISAARAIDVAKEVRRIAHRIGADCDGVRFAVKAANDELRRSGDDIDAVVSGIRAAVAHECVTRAQQKHFYVTWPTAAGMAVVTLGVISAALLWLAVAP